MAELLDTIFEDLGATSDEYLTDEFIPTGSVAFDELISKGQGIPRGKFIQLTSESGLGKSTMMLHFCKTACQQGYKCVYLDAEKALNSDIIKGVGLEEFVTTHQFVGKPVNTFEDVEAVLDKILVKDDSLAYIVIDSITALMPQKLLEASVGAILPGMKARVMSLFLEKYKAKLELSGSKVTILFLNQTRVKLNFMGTSSTVEAGGNAQRFYMDIRLFANLNSKLEKTMKTNEGKAQVQYGSNVNVWAIKNRYNNPDCPIVVPVIFGKGVSNVLTYVRWLEAHGYIKKAGAFLRVQPPRGGEAMNVRGYPGAVKWVKENFDDVVAFVNENGGIKLTEGVDM